MVLLGFNTLFSLLSILKLIVIFGLKQQFMVHTQNTIKSPMEANFAIVVEVGGGKKIGIDTTKFSL